MVRKATTTTRKNSKTRKTGRPSKIDQRIQKNREELIDRLLQQHRRQAAAKLFKDCDYDLNIVADLFDEGAEVAETLGYPVKRQK